MKILVLSGDGIGPEVCDEAVSTLSVLAEKKGVEVTFEKDFAGGAAIDHCGDPMPDSVIGKARASDAVLLGAVGGEKWDHLTGSMRPESGLLKIRRELGVFANLRPVAVTPALAEASPLRPEAIAGTDMLVVRELTGGIYFGEPRGRSGEKGHEEAYNTMRYTTAEIERVARVAFTWARRRGGRVCSVDKANVLVVSQLWRDTVTSLHQQEFSDVELSHMYVDNAAMQLVVRPSQFDVILTGNLFGDILSDAAATLGGSLGLLPSASVGGPVGLFEPVHGSAPDIAGRGIANPVAMLLSSAMMMEELSQPEMAAAIRTGVHSALDAGLRTADLHREGKTTRVGTAEMAAHVRKAALESLS